MNVTIPLHPQAQKDEDAKANALLTALLNATDPAAVDTWMTNNVTTLTQARTVLTALALAVRYLYLK